MRLISFYTTIKGKELIISILVFFLFTFFFATSIQAKMMTIKGDKVNLRSGPGTKYSIKWEYGAGFPVKIIKKRGNWIQIKDFENDTGWVHKSLLQNNPQVIVQANKRKNDKINIRSKPGTQYSIVGKAYYGVVFEKLGRKSDWVKVKHESGLVGWIKKSLLWGY